MQFRFQNNTIASLLIDIYWKNWNQITKLIDELPGSIKEWSSSLNVFHFANGLLDKTNSQLSKTNIKINFQDFCFQDKIP